MKQTERTAPKDATLFFAWFKQESEAYWKGIKLKNDIFGFQIQPGTRWNPGLNDDEIARYEKDIGFAFPPIYKLYLKTMNGTDKKTINIYGRSSEPAREGSGFYAYPRDLAQAREMIAWVYESCHVTPADVDAREIPHIMPVVGHRFLVMDRCSSNPVLSMHGADIIPYASNLMAFLLYDVFHDAAPEPSLPADLHVKFWLE
nr:hypothetical protein [Candidatus Sigynarchaeum springense]